MLLSSRLLAQRQALLPAIARNRRWASVVPHAKKDKKKDEGGKIQSLRMPSDRIEKQLALCSSCGKRPLDPLPGSTGNYVARWLPVKQSRS